MSSTVVRTRPLINIELRNGREARVDDGGPDVLERFEIEAFLTLADELHFGQTAKQLHVSTTRISQIIHKLERRVGGRLFERTSRRVQLTAVGRQLHADLQPAWAQITIGLQHAVNTTRGIAGALRVGFVGAAGGQLLLQVAELFRDHHPDCDVQVREVQIGEALPWLLDGVVDLVLTTFPAEAPGLTTGAVLVSETRMLAVPAKHPLAHRKIVSLEDLALIPLIQLPTMSPAASPASPAPNTTPRGLPIEAGPAAATFQEMLTLIGFGRGAAPVGAHVRHYYPRPDVAYVAFSDAPPVEWGLVWQTDNATAFVLAFNRVAHDLVQRPGVVMWESTGLTADLCC